MSLDRMLRLSTMAEVMLREPRFFYGVPLMAPIAPQPDQEAGDNPKNDQYNSVTQSTESIVKKSEKNIYTNRQLGTNVARNLITGASTSNIPTVITSTGIISIAGMLAILASMRKFIWAILKFSKIIGCKKKNKKEEESEQDIDFSYYIRPKKKPTKV